MRISFILSFGIVCFCSPVFSSTSQDTLVIGYKDSPPFIYVNELGKIEGISFWLWSQIAEINDFNYKFVELPLSEILTGLTKDEIDLSINPLTITSQRNKVMDFSFPFYPSQSTVLVTDPNWMVKFGAYCRGFFSLNFLRAITALIIIVLIFGTLTWLAERNKNIQFESNIHGLWSGIWWSAVTMTTVGYGDKSPRTFLGRIIGLIWMFAAILLITSYTASVASSFTIKELSHNISGIRDLKTIRVGTVSSSASQDYLVRNFFKDIKSYPDIETGMKALMKHNIRAFIYDEPILRFIKESDTKYDNLEFLPIKFNSQFYGFAFPIGSALKDVMDDDLIRITETLEWKIILNEYGLSDF